MPADNWKYYQEWNDVLFLHWQVDFGILRKQAIRTFEIHHREWQLQKLQFNRFQLDYPRFEKLLSGPPHLSHYARGMQVLSF